jgi:hypothetical protein
MDNPELRLIALLVALVATAFLTGAGWYEQAVLDTAWPKKPAIVRPAEGGANRKLFWVPANIFAVVTLLSGRLGQRLAPVTQPSLLSAFMLSSMPSQSGSSRLLSFTSRRTALPLTIQPPSGGYA